MDGNASPGGPKASSATGSLERFILDIRHLTLIGELGGCPLTSHKAGRQAGGLQGPAWHPGEDAQARGPVKGSSQELSTIQVLLLSAEARACAHNLIQVLPEEFNKYESSSLTFYMMSGLT